ncbi:deoxyribodipyrimidine photo-lyase [Saccharibacter sp. 17.LH.SD]|uniref:cryptochrome/photolyase family protein n=1 Tax=Saccharibacter sp. 17.LH.SD TaxID=2689393 RepID=UPI001369B6A2|nr:deoxyribodipyrimidine photo-lyase [Saccharibacter sp. 17.LH.SD]MXV45049.1 deoxyribodipyrimidine photo-lyase [Saccharibacter sp. 17.LH.SD]
MPHRPVIVWFHDDLRLHDHPALTQASQTGHPLLCVFIFEEPTATQRAQGKASQWWLHGALTSLSVKLQQLGGSLLILTGNAEFLIPTLAKESNAAAIFTHARQTPCERSSIEAITRTLPSDVHLHQYWGNTLLEPTSIKNKTNGIYRVFTPFWNALKTQNILSPLSHPSKLEFFSWDSSPLSYAYLTLDTLLPQPNWASGLHDTWEPTLEAAHETLNDFIHHNLAHYESRRDQMGIDGSSRISPYLAFGQLSPRFIWHAVRQHGKHSGSTVCFLREIAWREFAHYTLYHSPDILSRNLKPHLDMLPWKNNHEYLRAWQNSRTGIPIVDAGMRELWHTGWMHNRARMITGSFLTRHLLTHWRAGEAWFWDTLVDANNANNAMNWQWVAGTGIDTMPFFRIFNPTTQAKKFDPHGDYIRHWIPELRHLSNRYLFEPWTAPLSHLQEAGITLGDHYPYPIIDLPTARKHALEALSSCKEIVS